MATISLPQSFQPISATAVKVLARLAAKRAVQQKLRDQGVRVSLFPYAELMRQAAEYLDKHPELYQQALERAKRMTAEGVFGKRLQRAYLSSSAQPKAPCCDNEISVQISGAAE
jgi:hypothetical protein